MQTFKQFISEAVIKKWNTTRVTVEKAIEFLNAHCKDGLTAIANDSVLYRGFTSSSHRGFTIIDTTNAARTSRDTNNLYQLMMDSSVALKDFPSRTKSLICTTDIHKANEFGRPVIVIPVDGTTLAVCDHDDFFTVSFDDLENLLPDRFELSVEQFSYDMGKLVARFGAKTDGGKFKDIKKIDSAMSKVSAEKAVELWFKKSLDKIDPALFDAKKVLRLFEKYPQTRFSTFANLAMTPRTIETKLKKFGSKLPEDREVWFSGKAMLIEISLFYDILREMEKAKMRTSMKLVQRIEDYVDDEYD